MKGLPVATFKITDRSLGGMRSAKVPDDVLQKLATIKDQEVRGQGPFISLLQQKIGYEVTAKYQPVILKACAIKHKRSRRLEELTVWHWVLKVFHSTILSAAMLLAIFVLDLLVRLMFSEHNPQVEVIKGIKNWAHIGMFMIYLMIKILHNLGMI